MLVAISMIGSAVGKSTLGHRGAAVVDRLTGSLNRRALEARGVQVLHQARVMRAPVSVVLGDLDHFKRVNDAHGHAHGDLVLREVAERLEDNLRATETVFRLGGEEFVVLLPGCPAADAEAVAERLRAAVAAEPVAALPLTMSFGVATMDPDEEDGLEALLARADAALYAAKRDGRDRVRAAVRSGAAPETAAAPA
jgi:diguanylate cyclase (GGDEF)-like protein